MIVEILKGILLATVIVGGSGAFIGIFLGLAGKKLAVWIDEKELAIRDALPGNNCGGCGFPGCDGLAKAIASNLAPIDACPVGGEASAKVIGDILGQQSSPAEKKVAFVKCMGDYEKTKQNYPYTGVEKCSMMQFLPTGGPKACNYGCLGYGECVEACPFDAIHIVKGIALVDKEACKACGKCIKVCPLHLIEYVPYKQETRVACASKDKGKAVMNSCQIGCIACKKCEKTCQHEAILVEENIAKIDYDKCVDCGECKEVCPRNCII